MRVVEVNNLLKAMSDDCRVVLKTIIDNQKKLSIVITDDISTIAGLTPISIIGFSQNLTIKIVKSPGAIFILESIGNDVRENNAEQLFSNSTLAIYEDRFTVFSDENSADFIFDDALIYFIDYRKETDKVQSTTRIYTQNI